MTSRYIPTGGGGGGGGGAHVEWGPNFGEQEELPVGAEVSLAELALDNTKGVLVAAQLSALAADYTATGIDVAVTMPELALDHTKDIDALVTMPELALDHTKGVAVLAVMDELALDSTDGVGVHMSGEILGPPFWQSVATATDEDAAGVASITVTKPAGTVEDDLLVAFIGASSADNTTITAPGGWSNTTAHVDQGVMTARAFHKVAGGAEPADYTFTLSSISPVTQTTGEIHRVQAIDTADPIDVSATATLSAGAGDPDPDAPSVTTTVANTLVFAFLLHDHAAIDQSHTPAANHLERTDFDSSLAAVFLGSCSQTKVFSAIAATGTVEFNCTQVVGTDACLIRVAVAPGSFEIAA